MKAWPRRETYVDAPRSSKKAKTRQDEASAGRFHMSGLFEAAHMAAGPDEVRKSRFLSKHRAVSAVSRAECPRFLDRPVCIMFASAPLPEAWLVRTDWKEAYAGSASFLKTSPLVKTAQAMRAILLANATVTSLAGFFSKSFLTQSKSLPAYFRRADLITAVAPVTRSVLK